MQKRSGAKRTPRQRSEFGDGVPIASHRERLASDDAIEHTAPVVAQLSDGDFGHVSWYHR